MAGTYVRVQFSLINLFFKKKVFYKLKTKGDFSTLKFMIKETEIETFVWHFVALENLISKLMWTLLYLRINVRFFHFCNPCKVWPLQDIEESILSVNLRKMEINAWSRYAQYKSFNFWALSNISSYFSISLILAIWCRGQ